MHREQHRGWISKMCLGVTLTSVVVFLSGVVTAQPAQARTFTVLHNFTGSPDGEISDAGLIRDKAGNLYGTTVEGGSFGGGAVFRVDASGTETVLYSFCSVSGCIDGANPYAGLVRDKAGNLYGTTAEGGSFGYGTVFKLDTGGTEAVLYSFMGSSDGANPSAGLVRDVEGNLYGTTQIGGAFNGGAVFKVDTTGTESVLYSFDGSRGNGPVAGLIFDKSGNLYGTTVYGGYGHGDVFKLAPSSSGWKESVLYTFTGGVNGGSPRAGVILDKSGNVYGTTEVGGTYDGGTVFRLKPSSKGAWNISVLYAFTGNNDGGAPDGGVIFDTSGNLYGTTFGGGYYQGGTVFKVKPTQKGQWKESVLYDFTGGTDGANPFAGLVHDATGNFYGTASQGGSNGFGTVWKLTP